MHTYLCFFIKCFLFLFCFYSITQAGDGLWNVKDFYKDAKGYAHWLTAVEGDAKRQEKILFCVFNAPSGEWASPANWYGKLCPANKRKCEFAYVEVKAGCTLTLSKSRDAMPYFSCLNIGSRISDFKTDVYIKEGSEIRAYCVAMPDGMTKGVDAVLHIDGGTLKVGELCELREVEREEWYCIHFHDSLMQIGCNSSYSGMGTVEVRSGNLQAVMHIGGVLPNTNVGTLRVVGSASQITVPKMTGLRIIPGTGRTGSASRATMPKSTRCSQTDRHIFKVNPFGTLEFILDKDGVTPLYFATADGSAVSDGKIRAEFAQGARIRVDGAAYRGEIPCEIDLLLGADVKVADGVQTECKNFENATARILFEENRVVLVLDKK